MKGQLKIKILTVALLIIGCNSNRLEVDVSQIDLGIKIERFEQELFETHPDSLHIANLKFHKKYGNLYSNYVENVLGIGLVSDPVLGYNLKSFVSDKYMKQLYEDCRQKIPEMSIFEEELTDAFKHYRYYFPQKTVPQITTYISGLQYKIVVTEKHLGIGIDMYLGSDYENYRKSGLPMYLISGMESKYLVADAMKSWVSTEIEDTIKNQTLLGAMVHQGKIMYLLDAMLPQMADSLKMGYTAQQTEWCEQNEFQIWAAMVDKKLLYTTAGKTINKFFNDGPFTSGFPKESPARTGAWLGWQIVRSFMKENTSVSVQDLMKMNKAQVILSKSGYKPAK
ncbi:MAG: hypothetical protein COA57_02770 [Flavobacteriales bacterium]|nr:hypothetical protein [Bacteroidales bacterium AH-315-I05]PCJ89040.1 MAG: hypothetical protein COA57_02770 [Flavobacteriales bacterium]